MKNIKYLLDFKTTHYNFTSSKSFWRAQEQINYILNVLVSYFAIVKNGTIFFKFNLSHLLKIIKIILWPNSITVVKNSKELVKITISDSLILFPENFSNSLILLISQKKEII